MKDPRKLQEKLRDLLRYSRLHVGFDLSRPLSDLELQDIAWVVQNHVNANPEVIECDPLKDWLDEFRFWSTSLRSTSRTGTSG